MGLIKKLSLLFLLVLLSACSEFDPDFVQADIETDKQASEELPPNTPPEEPEPEDSDIINWPAFDWDNQHEDYLAWNKITFDGITELGPSLINRVPTDINSFCPNFEVLEDDEKKLFWVSLIAAMSRYESSFDPTVAFVEGFNDSSGKPVVSRGLLQLSRESALGYGCPTQNELVLHYPKVNLECTARILDRWVERDGVISDKVSGKWKGGARYWAVLRKESTLNKIKEKTRNFELCRL